LISGGLLIKEIPDIAGDTPRMIMILIAGGHIMIGDIPNMMMTIEINIVTPNTLLDIDRLLVGGWRTETQDITSTIQNKR